MGVKGLWTILKSAAQERSLVEIAISEGFITNRRGLQSIVIGIDASVWFSQAQFAFRIGHAQAGQNPKLRSLFFKLTHLLKVPVTPLFIFDGPNRPSVKRGVNVISRPNWLTTPFQEFLDAFGYQYYTAPGEAEAELARLNETRIVDAVITEDSDSFIFGATHVIRDWISNAKAGLDAVRVYTAQAISERPEISLTRGGMILIALLSGGDYNPAGLPDCGITIGHGLARAGFGDSLLIAALTLSVHELDKFLVSWRQELRTELASNPNGNLSRKYPALAQSIPDSFPNPTHLLFYAKPLTSWSDNDAGRDFSFFPLASKPDIARLANICKQRFDWGNAGEGILAKFSRVLWDGLCVRMLSNVDSDIDDENSFGSSSILCIRSLKSAEPPATGLELYRVVYSTLALDLVMGQDADANNARAKKTTRSIWVPTSLLDYSLPDMVTYYTDQHGRAAGKGGLPLKPILADLQLETQPDTAPESSLAAGGSGSASGHTTSSFSAEVIDLTMDELESQPDTAPKSSFVPNTGLGATSSFSVEVIDLTMDDDSEAEKRVV